MVSDIPAIDGKIDKPFFTVYVSCNLFSALDSLVKSVVVCSVGTLPCCIVFYKLPSLMNKRNKKIRYLKAFLSNTYNRYDWNRERQGKLQAASCKNEQKVHKVQYEVGGARAGSGDEGGAEGFAGAGSERLE